MVEPAMPIRCRRCRDKDDSVGVEGEGVHTFWHRALSTMGGIGKRARDPCSKAVLASILVGAHDARGYALEHAGSKAIAPMSLPLRLRLALRAQKAAKRGPAAQAGKDGIDGRDPCGTLIAHQSPRVLTGGTARGRKKLERRCACALPRG